MDKFETLFSKNKQTMYTASEVASIIGVSTDTCRRTLDRMVQKGSVEKFKFGAKVKYAAKLGKTFIHPSTVSKGKALADKWEAQGIEFDDSALHTEASQYGIKLDSGEKVVRELSLIRRERQTKNTSLWSEATADALYHKVQGEST